MAKHPLPHGPWFRFIVYWTNKDTRWQNDLWYNVTASGTSANLINVLNDFTTMISSLWLNNINDSNTLYAVKLYANNGTFTESRTVYPGTEGDVVLGVIPIQVTLVGAISSDIATRQGQGRIKIGGISSEDLDGDYPSTGAVTWVNALLAGLGGFVESAGWTMALAVWDRVTAVLHDVLTSAISGKLGSMRRRIPRV
jgi:hypothetical protein